MKKRREFEKLSLSKKTISRIGAEVSKLLGGAQHTPDPSNRNNDTDPCNPLESHIRTGCCETFDLSCICGR